MAGDLVIPRNLPAAMPGIRLDATLDEVGEALRTDYATSVRATIRLAVNAALSKRVHFGGRLHDWLPWYQQFVPVARRTAILHDNAGQVLVQHMVQFTALVDLPLEWLEVMKPLSSRQIGGLLPAVQNMDSRDDLRRSVANILGRRQPKPAAPRQLALPGFDVLDDYRPEELDPYREMEYAARFVNRTSQSLLARPDAMTAEQKAETADWLRTFAAGIPQLLSILGG